jgi:hypothetical protein
MGARVPIALTGRTDGLRSRFASCALIVMGSSSHAVQGD